MGGRLYNECMEQDTTLQEATHMVKIFVKPGARIVEVTEGRGLPRIRIVGRGGIRARATLHTDPTTNDSCYEFNFQGANWTVDVDQTTVIEQA